MSNPLRLRMEQRCFDPVLLPRSSWISSQAHLEGAVAVHVERIFKGMNVSLSFPPGQIEVAVHNQDTAAIRDQANILWMQRQEREALTLLQLAAAQPDDQLHYSYFGEYAVKLGRYDLITRCQRDPQLAGSDLLKVRGFTWLATALLMSGNPGAAASKLQAALAVRQGYPEAQPSNAMAVIEYTTGNRQQAQKHLQDCIRQIQQHYQGYGIRDEKFLRYNLAVTCLALGHLKSARTHCDELLRARFRRDSALNRKAVSQLSGQIKRGKPGSYRAQVDSDTGYLLLLP